MTRFTSTLVSMTQMYHRSRSSLMYWTERLSLPPHCFSSRSSDFVRLPQRLALPFPVGLTRRRCPVLTRQRADVQFHRLPVGEAKRMVKFNGVAFDDAAPFHNAPLGRKPDSALLLPAFNCGVPDERRQVGPA